MLKKIFLFFVLFSIASCQSIIGEELEKTAKSRGASERINSSDSNSRDLFKELD